MSDKVFVFVGSLHFSSLLFISQHGVSSLCFHWHKQLSDLVSRTLGNPLLGSCWRMCEEAGLTKHLSGVQLGLLRGEEEGGEGQQEALLSSHCNVLPL